MSERARFLRYAGLASVAAGLYGGAVFAAEAGASYDWLVDVLLCAAIAFSAFHGRVAGAVLGAVAAIAISLLWRDSGELRFGEFLEWAILIATTLVARDRIDRARRSQEQLQALLDSVDDAAFVLDASGRYLEVWGPQNRLLAAGEVLRGKCVHDYLPPDVTALVMNTIAETLAGQRRCNVDYKLEVEGRQTWWNAMVTPIGSRRVLWVARDITARKTAESELKLANEELARRAKISDFERSHAMDALRASEIRYREIVEQARDIIFTLDPHGFITSLNDAFETTLGWSIDEWLGRDFRELLAPRVRALGDVELARAHAHEHAHGDEIPLTRALVLARDGREVILELSLVNQRINGVTRSFFGLARDVTTREKAQEALRRSERQLADSQRIARLGSWEYDLVTGQVHWSEEHYRLFGMDPSERITFERFCAIIGQTETEKLRALDGVLRDRATAEWELKVTVGGEEKILSCVGRLVRNAEGIPIRIFGSAQDVTQQRRNEQRLRESDERFRLMSRATNDVVWDWDLISNVLWWGDGLDALFGWNAQGFDAIESWRERIHPDDEQRVATSVAEACASTAESWSSDYRFRCADGSYAYVLDRAYIVRNAEGRAVRLVGAISDLTERQRMQEQLDEATRLSSLGRVAASIAHEFNNVLMGMQANLEVLRRRAPIQLAKPVEHVLHAVLRGKRVTDEILSYTRGSAPSLQDVLVSQFLTRWEHEIRPVLGTSIRLMTDADAGLYMRVDPLQIAQVLTNLALNARDAMPKGGTLRISVTRSGGGWLGSRADRELGFILFRVQDDGVGMSREVSKHMFEPLFTTKHGGTGLGLAISYQIVNRHGGFISAESEPGRGTTFDLLLPATDVPEAVVEELAPVSLACRSVVIVDDDEGVVAGLSTLLELDHVRVRVATRGGDAMPLLEDERPDAVILDIGLPDMNGVDVYERIAERWPSLPVLFSSGHADAARLEPLLRRANVGLLLKPYDYDTLQRALAELLDGNGTPPTGNDQISLRVN
jgi:PAS domain S-box-containing protein